MLCMSCVEFPSSFIYEEKDCLDFDSGYSDVSGLSSPTSPCSLSPPSSPVLISEQLQGSEKLEPLTLIYYPAYSLYYLYPVYPDEIEFIPEVIFEEPPTLSTAAKTAFHANRLIKWTLPPPIVPYFPLPGWEPMP